MNDMAIKSLDKFLKAINCDIGLCDDFVYHMDYNDYKSFPDPYPRTTFYVKEVQESITRYPNPQKPGTDFQWDIHGRLLLPEKPSLANVAVVIIPGGAANEYEFLFTPDGPPRYVDFTREPASRSRVGIAQHLASLGVAVLCVSLPGHFSRAVWPPIPQRKLEFVIGETPSDNEFKNRLAVYTFRMCLEALKVLIERNLPEYNLYIWGHSTGGEHFYLMEQYGLKNKLIGGLGYGTGVPASVRKAWGLTVGEIPKERAKQFESITDVSRRSPKGYEKNVGIHQPWGAPDRWFELENDRRTQLKPFLQEIEHQGLDVLLDEVRRKSNLPDEELFVTMRADLNRLRDKKMLYFVGQSDKGHWLEHGDRGLRFRREGYGMLELAKYTKKLRLVVLSELTHYGHIELHNDKLANLMVTGFKSYF